MKGDASLVSASSLCGIAHRATPAPRRAPGRGASDGVAPHLVGLRQAGHRRDTEPTQQPKARLCALPRKQPSASASGCNGFNPGCVAAVRANSPDHVASATSTTRGASPTLREFLCRPTKLPALPIAWLRSCPPGTARDFWRAASRSRSALDEPRSGHSDELHATHEFLANRLGVRRVGVIEAATSLQDRKLIRYRGGNVTILDRAGLRAASYGCYRADKAASALMLRTQ